MWHKSIPIKLCKYYPKLLNLPAMMCISVTEDSTASILTHLLVKVYVWDRRVIIPQKKMSLLAPFSTLPLNPAVISCPSLTVPVSLCK